MITCQLMGGLGNILFQIATTYSLSLDNNDECGFDISNHTHQTQISVRFNKDNILRNVKDLTVNSDSLYNEPSFEYKRIPYIKNLKLHGYFQSEKYFIHNRDKILKLFEPRQQDIEYIKNKYNIDENSISIHIRRGDYLNIQHIHPICEKEYYNNALNLLDGKKVYIFSNDIEWCKNNLKIDNGIYVVGEQNYIDLYMMSMCSDNIIANSSFSWWGSWLNKNENKRVIAPKKWFGSSQYSTKDLYCNSWIIV